MVGVGIEKGMAPPDVVEFDRGHGRLEVREYWWVKADKDISWPDVRWYGKVRRERTLLYKGKRSIEEVMAIYGGGRGLNPSPKELSRWVRGHWEIENGVFWVLDVSYNEDRNNARKVGRPLHAIRCAAINVIRLQGFQYIPDGHRAASARPDRGLAWLYNC